MEKNEVSPGRNEANFVTKLVRLINYLTSVLSYEPEIPVVVTDISTRNIHWTTLYKVGTTTFSFSLFALE